MYNNEGQEEMQKLIEENENLQGYCQNLENELDDREKIQKDKLNKKMAANEDLLTRLQEMEE